MAQIIERTIQAETEKRLVLQKEQIGRTISIGSNWDSIRIGFRHSISNDSNVKLSAPGVWAFGLCSGTSNMFLDDTTTHFLGVRTTGGGWQAINYTLPNGIYIHPNVWKFSSKVGNTYVDSDFTTSSTYPSISTDYKSLTTTVNTIGCSAWIIDITKGDPNWIWTIYSGSWYSTSINRHVSYYKFINSINNNLVDKGADNFVVWASGSVTVNETLNGFLDTINIAWQSVSETLEISDVAYAILE